MNMTRAGERAIVPADPFVRTRWRVEVNTSTGLNVPLECAHERVAVAIAVDVVTP